MKKLLLYLMTLLVFGAVPVSSFATQYLVVPSKENGWDISTMEELPNGSVATMTGVKIGAGKFALGVYDDTANKISWYKLGTSSQTLPEEMPKGVVFAETTLANKSYAPNYALDGVVDGTEGKIYEVTFNLRQYKVTVTPDNSNYSVYYQANGTSNGQAQHSSLGAAGQANFEVNTGSNTYINLWLQASDTADHEVFGNGSGITYSLSGSATVFEYSNNAPFTVNNDATASRINGLEANTSYQVYVNFSERLVTIRKVPVELYLRGYFATGGWNNFGSPTNRAANRFQTQIVKEGDTEVLYYVGHWRFYQNNDGYFCINVGPNPGNDNREFQYNISDPNNNYTLGSGDRSKWLPLVKVNAGASIKFNIDKDTDYLIKVKLDSNNKPAQFWIEEYTGDDVVVSNDYPNYFVTTHYGPYSHTTQNIYQENDMWYSKDNGQRTTTSEDEIIYDGLRLGYDNFCIETLSPDGTRLYWALPSKGTVTPGEKYVFTAMTKGEAMQTTSIDPNSQGLVNSRYDVIWNFNTHECQVVLNDAWMSGDNQMYLYRLSADEIANNVHKGNMLTVIEAAIANESPDLFILERSGDGIYEHDFFADDNTDLPKGTQFVIVGRTGQVYNLDTPSGDSYSFTNSFDPINHTIDVTLTNSDAQEPAIINTDQLANNDFVVRVRTNFTGTLRNKKYENAYILTFTEQTKAPDHFVIYLDNDAEHGIDIPQSGNSKTYTLYPYDFASCGTADDYSSYKVYAQGEGPGWDNSPYGGNANKNGYIVIENVPLHNTRFQIMVQNGGEKKYYSQGTLTLDTPKSLDGNDGAQMKVNGAGANESFNILYHIPTNTITVSRNQLTAPAGSTGKYMFKAVYADGTEKNFGPATYTDAVNKTYNSNAETIDIPLNADHGDGGIWYTGHINPAQVYIEWNNGNPMLMITPAGTDKEVTVYFVDRAKWGGTMAVYAYSDLGLHSNDGDWEGVEATIKNGTFPGQDMKPLNSADPMYKSLGLQNKGITIWEQTIKMSEYPDGGLSMPKVIFAKNDKKYQTKNLYLVDGGIYSNASADGANPATEYLPRMQYTYFASNPSDREIIEYDDTPYNVIYVDVPEFTKYVKDGGKLAVSIVYDRDGNGEMDYEALGIPGKHQAMLCEIAGVEMLRVPIAEFIVPDGVKINLNFWEGDDSSITNTDNAHHKDPLDKEYLNKYTDDKYTCTHSLCWGSHCSLNFANVDYKDGYIYRRAKDSEGNDQDPIITIEDYLKPEAVYIVNTAPNAGWLQTAMTKYEAVKPAGTQNGIANCYSLELMDNNEASRMKYIIPEVPSSAQFYILAKLKSGTWVSYSTPSPIDMTPNMPYTYQKDKSNNIGINGDIYEVNTYNIAITFADNEVIATPNKVNANFQFVTRNSNGELITRYKSGLALPAHADLCDEDHLTPILFTYAPGYDNDAVNGDAANSKLAKLTIKFTPASETLQFFPTGSINQRPELVKRKVENVQQGEILCGDYVKILSPSNGSDEEGLASILVKAYTAGMYDISIAQTNTDDSWARTDLTIPVRVYPTFESVGFTINNFTINQKVNFAEEGEEENWITPFKVDENSNLYTINLAHDAGHNDGDVQFKDRLHFQAKNAQWKIAGKEVLKYYWGEDPDFDPNTPSTTPQRAPQRRASNVATVDKISSVVERPDFGSTNLLTNPNAEPFSGEMTTSTGNTIEMKPYSIYNAPRVEIDKNGNATKTAQQYVQLEQNGIKSPAYKLVANRTPDIPTEVEEILGVEEGEAVYYNLNGFKVDADRLEPGIYVKVQGNHSEKIYVK
ncbi:MAG: DUF2141 domain-containing protein [Muribaculaceae bacterium]|nr:DUF2141 domain-containing protein [Muribaculaceae bacterium]